MAYRVVDSHQHVFWHGRDDQGLVDDLDEHGIEYCWLLSWELLPHEDHPGYHAALNPVHFRADGTHAGIPLSDLLLARSRHPSRFLVGFCPHPLLGSAPQRLQAAHRIHGVQVCGEWKFRLPFDDPRCLELFYAAGELKLPVVLHLDVPYLQTEAGRKYQQHWYGGTIDNLARALDACPQTNFIGHAPGFWRELSGDAASDPAVYPQGPIQGLGRLYGLFDDHPNLWADLSAGSALHALRRDRSHAERFLTRYQDRLLFGRDFYGGELRAFLDSLQLDDVVLAKLFHRNAERLVSPPAG